MVNRAWAWWGWWLAAGLILLSLPVLAEAPKSATPDTVVQLGMEPVHQRVMEMAWLAGAWLAEAYQDTVFVNHTRRQWTTEADAELRRGLRKLDGTGAEVTHHVPWARPVDALVAASHRSSVLVLSRQLDRPRA